MISAKVAKQISNRENVVLDTKIYKKIIENVSDRILTRAICGNNSLDLICVNPNHNQQECDIIGEDDVVIYLNYTDSIEFLYSKILILTKYLESHGYVVRDLTKTLDSNFRFQISW